MKVTQLPRTITVSDPHLHNSIEKAAHYVVLTVSLNGDIEAFTNIRRSNDLNRTLLNGEPVLEDVVNFNQRRS